MCSMKKVFLEILQNSQENTCTRASKKETLAQVFSCECCEISKTTFYRTKTTSYRTSPAAASGISFLATSQINNIKTQEIKSSKPWGDYKKGVWLNNPKTNVDGKIFNISRKKNVLLLLTTPLGTSRLPVQIKPLLISYIPWRLETPMSQVWN